MKKYFKLTLGGGRAGGKFLSSCRDSTEEKESKTDRQRERGRLGFPSTGRVSVVTEWQRKGKMRR